MISPKVHLTETLILLVDSFHAHCWGVGPAPQKGPWDEAEEDMLGCHIYKGGSHLCQLKIAVVGLELQIKLTSHYHVSSPRRAQTDWR